MTSAGQFGPYPFIDSRGNALPGVEILIYDSTGTTLAALYSDRARTPLTNPIPTGVADGIAGVDTAGNAIFWADADEYLMVVRYGGTQRYQAPITVSADPDDANAVLSVNGRSGIVIGLAEQSALDAEATTRGNADTAEATARANAITTEATTRANADTAEATARATADALLIPLTQKGAASGVATLDGSGKVPSAQIPQIAISDYLGDVASQAAMLALTGQRGDWCTRSDLAASFILIADDASQLVNWKQLPTPTDAVLSVNSRVGAVTGLAEANASNVAASAAAWLTAIGAQPAGTSLLLPTGVPPTEINWEGLHGAGSAAAMSSTRTAWDDFHRPDGELGYSVSPSGHLWEYGTIDQAKMVIVGNKFVPTDQEAAVAHIAFLRHSTNLDFVGMEFEHVGGVGPQNDENVVIGACAVGFGAAGDPGGSIQLGIWGDGAYELFCVPDPIVGPYITLLSGTLTIDLDITGQVRYRASMRRVSHNRCVVTLPDGQVVTYTDDVNKYIETYWSPGAFRAGFQVRPPHPLENGNFRFTYVETGGDTQNDRLDGVLSLTGDSKTRVLAAKPADWTIGDLDLSLVCIAADWAGNYTDFFMTNESVTGLQGWRWYRSTTGVPVLRVYPDGDNFEAIQGDTAIPITTNAVRVTRNATTGDTKFYVSTDFGANWTQNGSTIASTPGAPFPCPGPIRIGQTGSFTFIGTLYSASIGDGVRVWMAPDFTHVWPERYTDAQGNVWSLRGKGYAWIPTAGPLTTYALKRVPIPADKTDNYVAVASDVGSSIGVDAATAKTVTINSGIHSIGDVIEFRQMGAGQITLTPGASVTFRAPGSALKTRARYSAISVLCIATDTFSVQGDAIP